MENKIRRNLLVSPAPHLVSDNNTRRIMLDVIIALMPALLIAWQLFGPRALALTAICVAACVFFEFIFNVIAKKDQTITDLSAVVTGIIMAYNLPSIFPFWMAIIGCFVAIIVVKQLFGGLGQNFANPAVTARIVLLLSFTAEVSTSRKPLIADVVTGPTPLGILAEGTGELPSNFALFVGNIGGSMGEVSSLALLLGGAYLLIRRIISPATPVAFIATVAVVALVAGQDPIFHICAGGVMLGAFFMATDYATTPITTNGKIIFGIGCGLLTMLIRLFGSYPEGVSFAILIMNILTPHINTLCMKRLYGGGKKS